MRASSVIRGFRAEVDPAAIGRPMEAILSIQQRPSQGRGAIETLLEHVSKAPETLRVMALTGTTDFIIHVAVRDMDHLRAVVGALTGGREVARLQSSLIFAKAEGPELMPLD